MKTLRALFFWSHLTAGVLAGLVILVMSFTGAVLALKPQILNYLERDVRFVTAQEAPRLPPSQLLTAVTTARPDAVPQSIIIGRDPTAAAAVSLGRDGNLYVHPYTGAVLGTGSASANQFFQSMTNWHRYLNATGDARDTGRAATGAANFAFLILSLTGLYIWMPKQFTFRHFKPVLWFRRTATSRARDFNWHNVIGLWCAPAIIVMTASGVVMSYQWGNNLVYQITGSPIPAGRGSGTVGGGPAGAGGDTRREPQRASSTEGADAARVTPETIDQLWAKAGAQLPTWSQMTMRLPVREGDPVQFTITDGANWNQFARSNLTLSSRDGRVAQWQPYSASNAGQKLRGWLRFAHTGELGGVTAQIIAGVGCLGGVMLVWTGLSLAIRRLWNWSLWSRVGIGRRTFSSEPAAD